MRFLFLVVIGLFLQTVAGCDDPQYCVPGFAYTCSCSTSTVRGEQTCSTDGLRLHDCVCPAATDLGLGDLGAQDAQVEDLSMSTPDLTTPGD